MESYYDATDKSVYTSTLFQQPEFKIISEKIKNYLSTEYSEQVKVEEEKIQKKKEAERLRKIEIQRILNAKMSEPDDRRVEQEWALTNDIDEEGKMAWAVLNYLENEGATVRDREQEERLLEINTEIDRLNLEYEQDDEVRSDILDQINELEEERDEILEMIDVYYIIPETYEHYEDSMSPFGEIILMKMRLQNIQEITTNMMFMKILILTSMMMKEC